MFKKNLYTIRATEAKKNVDFYENLLNNIHKNDLYLPVWQMELETKKRKHEKEYNKYVKKLMKCA